MFNRLFNILRANMGDALSSDEQKMKEIDEEYARYFRTSPNANSGQSQYSQQYTSNDYTQGHQPQVNKEELEHFAVLDLKPGASFQDIKSAYKTLVKQYHPDRFHNDPARHKAAVEITQRLNKAYDYFERKYNHPK